MVDRFGREISYLRLSVTERCDLRCRYCMPEGGVCEKELLTQDEMVWAVEAAAAAALGVRKLRITGGGAAGAARHPDHRGPVRGGAGHTGGVPH